MELSDYRTYPDHPLYGINKEILDCAREVTRHAAMWKDVDEDMADPIADAIIASLRENGWLKE